MVAIISKQRFDDVGEPDDEGSYEYAYHGFNYEVAVSGCVFQVRTYDDEPGDATVISPTDARTRPEARPLVEFITVSLKCTSVQFYCGRVGTYQPVDLRTLKFVRT